MSQQHKLFPVTLSTEWFSPLVNTKAEELPKQLLDWLLDSGSLTARLKQHSAHFRVELLGQQVQACLAAEANDMITEGEQVLVREVLLHCDDKPQVFARSLIPLASLTGEEQKLANLGTQSLGHVLFNSPSLERHHIEISMFALESSVVKFANSLQLTTTQALWGRRSIFMLENKPLMVAEVFLPDAFAYQGM
jgi:chorismate--pyruvate lyase